MVLICARIDRNELSFYDVDSTFCLGCIWAHSLMTMYRLKKTAINFFIGNLIDEDGNFSSLDLFKCMLVLL